MKSLFCFPKHIGRVIFLFLTRSMKSFPLRIKTQPNVKPISEWKRGIFLCWQQQQQQRLLDAPFQARTLPLFLELGWLPINHLCNARRLCLFKNILDGRALDYLTQKLSSFKFNKLYDTRSRLDWCMIYKQRNLLSFVLVSIVERAREMFLVLFNATSC